jgi:hypothetical protein
MKEEEELDPTERFIRNTPKASSIMRVDEKDLDADPLPYNMVKSALAAHIQAITRKTRANIEAGK